MKREIILLVEKKLILGQSLIVNRLEGFEELLVIAEDQKRLFFYLFLHLQNFQGGQPSYMKRGILPKTLKTGGTCPPVVSFTE